MTTFLKYRDQNRHLEHIEANEHHFKSIQTKMSQTMD